MGVEGNRSEYNGIEWVDLDRASGRSETQQGDIRYRISRRQQREHRSMQVVKVKTN